MQRAARSIVPTENREGFVGDETDNSTVSNTESQASGASEPKHRSRLAAAAVAVV